MQIITPEQQLLLNHIISRECENINLAFNNSELLGKVMLSNAITSFKNVYLMSIYGDIIPAMSTEYRYFVIGILNGIKEEYQGIAISEVILPTIPEFDTDELLLALKGEHNADVLN